MTLDHRWPPVSARAMRALQDAYGSDREIGQALGKSSGAVKTQRRLLGIVAFKQPRSSAEWPPKTPRDMKALQRKYGIDSAIAEAVGRTKTSVWELRKKFGVAPIPRECRPQPERGIAAPAPAPEAEKTVTATTYEGADAPAIAFAREPLYSQLGEEAIVALYDDRVYEDDPRPVRDRRR